MIQNILLGRKFSPGTERSTSWTIMLKLVIRGRISALCNGERYQYVIEHVLEQVI